MRAVCKLKGHKWQLVWGAWGPTKGAPCYVCLRCRENGWMIKSD